MTDEQFEKECAELRRQLKEMRESIKNSGKRQAYQTNLKNGKAVRDFDK